MHAWVNYIAYACQYNEEASINIRNHVSLIVLRKTYVESCLKIELRFLRDTLYVTSTPECLTSESYQCISFATLQMVTYCQSKVHRTSHNLNLSLRHLNLIFQILRVFITFVSGLLLGFNSLSQRNNW